MAVKEAEQTKGKGILFRPSDNPKGGKVGEGCSTLPDGSDGGRFLTREEHNQTFKKVKT